MGQEHQNGVAAAEAQRGSKAEARRAVPSSHNHNCGAARSSSSRETPTSSSRVKSSHRPGTYS
jgi:hypothetical protein